LSTPTVCVNLNRFQQFFEEWSKTDNNKNEKDNYLKTSMNQKMCQTIFDVFQLRVEKYFVEVTLKFQDNKQKIRGFMKQLL